MPVLCAALLAAYLIVPFVIRGFRFPVGPDASVYIWWMNLARHDGLSVLGSRAGFPAAAIVLSEAFGITPVTLLAGMQCALGAAVGLAAGALTSGPVFSGRRFVLVGFLAGAFAVYVAAGYFSTLAFALLFCAAGACLAHASRRMVALSAALIGAAGVTHPLFVPVAAGTLGMTAVLAIRAGERSEAVRVGTSLASGAVVAGSAAWALLAGPAPLSVSTSRDGFLREAGLTGVLRHLYVRRLVLHAWDYVLFASVPLAVVGLPRVDGFVRRLLLAWATVTATGIVVGVLTRWFPPERLLSFAFVVPILAALGIERLLERRTVVAVGLACLGGLLMLAGAGWSWWHSAPPIYEGEADRASDAARYAAATPSGTPLVFQVAGPQPVLTFFAVRAANEIRAAMPPDRIRDVYVAVPPPPGGADLERRALSARSVTDVAAARQRAGLPALTFRLAAFLRAPFDVAGPVVEASPGVAVVGTPPTPPVESLQASLGPSTLARIAGAAIGLLAGLALVGSGWVWAASPTSAALPIAPAAGLGLLVLVAIVFERLGVPIDQRSGALAVLVCTTVGGWLVAAAVGRRRAGLDADGDKG